MMKNERKELIKRKKLKIYSGSMSEKKECKQCTTLIVILS